MHVVWFSVVWFSYLCPPFSSLLVSLIFKFFRVKTFDLNIYVFFVHSFWFRSLIFYFSSFFFFFLFHFRFFFVSILALTWLTCGRSSMWRPQTWRPRHDLEATLTTSRTNRPTTTSPPQQCPCRARRWSKTCPQKSASIPNRSLRYPRSTENFQPRFSNGPEVPVEVEAASLQRCIFLKASVTL